jgi:ABC-type nitrate/sulfonate/bicarbonate transport system permease component
VTLLRRLAVWGPSLWSIPLLLIAWQIAATAPGASRLMPTLGEIWGAFAADIRNGLLIRHATVTLERVFAGYALAVVVGVPLGIAMARSRTFELLFEPVFFVGYPVPKIALFPVFIFIFGIGTPSKIAFVFLECLYPVATAAFFAFRGIDKRLDWAARNMGAGLARRFFTVLLPAAAPGIFSGLRVAMPIAVVVVIITEMIGDSRGLGYYITIASATFRYEKIYAGIMMIGIIGFTIDRALHLLRRRAIHWESLQGVRGT